MLRKIVSNIDPNWPNILIDFHREIDLYVDSLHGFTENENYKILWVKEVEEISRFKDKAIRNHEKFDLILTYDQEILDLCRNSVMFEFGTSWVFDYDFKAEKAFRISHLTGSKSITYGHRLRQEVYLKQTEFSNPIDFYVSSRSPIQNLYESKQLGDSKKPLFESQFHICIENSKQKNLFTEKLIDCLVTKTVPVFYGCDNIGDFFDTRGFFQVEDFHQIVEVCNSLSPDSYLNMKEFVDKNYDLAIKYVNLLERLEMVLNNEIN